MKLNLECSLTVDYDGEPSELSETIIDNLIAEKVIRSGTLSIVCKQAYIDFDANPVWEL